VTLGTLSLTSVVIAGLLMTNVKSVVLIVRLTANVLSVNAVYCASVMCCVGSTLNVLGATFENIVNGGEGSIKPAG
jgi:hypothetical protein